jgi:hypothetical protein
MIDRRKVETIIESLDFVAKQPKMYLGVDDDPAIARSYLNGIRHAIRHLAEVDPHMMLSKWWDAGEAHGYPRTTRSPDHAMAEQGMSGPEIIVRLIQIEQTMYKLLLEDAD